MICVWITRTNPGECAVCFAPPATKVLDFSGTTPRYFFEHPTIYLE